MRLSLERTKGLRLTQDRHYHLLRASRAMERAKHPEAHKVAERVFAYSLSPHSINGQGGNQRLTVVKYNVGGTVAHGVTTHGLTGIYHLGSLTRISDIGNRSGLNLVESAVGPNADAGLTPVALTRIKDRYYVDDFSMWIDIHVWADATAFLRERKDKTINPFLFFPSTKPEKSAIVLLRHNDGFFAIISPWRDNK